MRIFPLLFLCLPSLGVLAAEPQDTTAERMLNLKEVVVTATVPQIDVIPAQKLSGEELKRLNSNSVADALRYFSGVQVKDYGGVGGIKTVNIRSMGTNHTGVVYDGVELGNAQNGQVDLGQFSLDNIDGISLYNGQKSEILQPAKDFGSAGSIYIRTRTPEFNGGETYHLRATLRAGSFDLLNPSALLELKLSDKVNASLSAEWINSSGKYKFRYRRVNPAGELAYDTTAVRQNGDINATRLEANLNGVVKSGQWHFKVYNYNSERGVPGAIVNNVWRRGERIWDTNSFAQVNYIADNGELKYRVYESQNKYESFGCTSQYGIIHGDKLIVMSKQATDGGDPRKGGGRVVVADAKTLKKLAAFDYIGADTDGDGNGDGDGRACVGVSENKVYLGSTAGIQVLDTRTLTLGGMVDGIASGANQYNGQIGDMVAIGKYAFAIQQGVGVHVIDIATDKVVKTFPVESNDASGVSGMGYPQGITVTADGNVWVATTAGASSGLCTFRCIDPSTLDVTDSVDLPEGQRVTCGWGAWRSTNFFASKSENAIWYGAGVEASIVSGNTGYYKWTVGSDIAGIQPVFVFPNNLAGVDSKTFQAPYAGVRYDDRKNQLLVAATHGASSNYRYNWLHFVDCKTGDIVKTIKLKDYYWFPSMPIFPDKYAPEFSDLPEVSVDLAKDGDIFTIDLKDYVTDKDNIDAAIRLSIVGGDAVAADNTVSDKRLVNATLENGVLTITPLIAGHGNLNVKAESNGKTTTVSIPYAVEDSASGIHNVDGAAGTLSVCDNIVTVKNMAGTTFAVYDMAGRVVGAFVAESDCARVALTLPSGVYVIASTNGSHTLKFSIQ